MDEYEYIFQEPSKLPPVKGIAHHINLQKGTKPINVRPYKNFYFQKVEIERQVQDMFKMVIIKLSVS